MPNRWVSHFVYSGVWLALAFLAGIWLGNLAWWLVGALALYLAVTLRNLYHLDRALEKGAPVPSETRGLWAELYSVAIRLRSKSRHRKKRYRRLLREVRQSTRALHDGGIILNARNEILWCNRAAVRLLGLNLATDVGQRIDNLIRNPDFVSHLEDPGGDTVSIPSPAVDGGQLSVQIIPYGKAQRLAIIRDITREVRLERTRRDFVANASHELRSPLTVIGGYLDALAHDTGIPKGWSTPVAEMERQVSRMTGILRDLIELTHLESSPEEAPHDFVDVVGMLKFVEREFVSIPGLPGISVHFMTDFALLGSEAEVHSIFHNLVSNAVRFTPPEGTVEVRWERNDNGAIFSVRDTGIGIPEECIPRVTERFFRVDPGRSRELGGTGLGLAIVKHALQRHGASLSIESEVGAGSLFACQFPDSRLVARGGASVSGSRTCNIIAP